MKSGRKFLLSGFIFFLLILFNPYSTHATIIRQTVPLTGGTPNLLESLTFDKWNNTPYTLLSVALSMDLSITGGYLTVDNDGALPATVTVELGAEGSIGSSDVTLLNEVFQPIFSDVTATTGNTFDLLADDGDGAGNIDPAPSDGATHVGGNASASDSGYIGSLFLNDFIGSGTYDILADINQILDFGGVGGVEGAFGPVTASGSVTVEYTDSGPVPEPSTMLLLGTGLVGLLGARRKFSVR